MARRVGSGWLLALLALLALAGGARAGGWTVVTVDELPQEVRAGEAVRVGFMLRQHGQTPVHDYGGEPLRPVLIARHLETGETVEAMGQKDETVGHFTAEVTFPREGVWEWFVDPVPFEGKMEPVQLTVLPAEAAEVEPAVAGVVQAAPAPRPLLRAGGVLLLLAAGGLALRRR